MPSSFGVYLRILVSFCYPASRTSAINRGYRALPHPLPTPVKSRRFPLWPLPLSGIVSLRGGAGLTVFAFVALIVFSAAFMLFPAIDLAVSGLFFVPGAGFALAKNEGLLALRSVSNAVTVAVALLGVLAICVPALWPRRSVMIRPSHGVFLLSTLAAGPGIIVNLVLKNNWGRARPQQTLEFGGDWPFTPAWANVDHCGDNCSFVSGEASAVFWLVALAFITPRPLRLPVLFAALAFTAAVSINRIAFGAHYLSDVVIAWVITLVVVAIGRWIILDRRRAGTIDAAFAGASRSKNRTAAASPKRDDRSEN